MTEDQREIRRKKRVIEYSEKNGDIKTACRRFGIAKSTFYVWRERIVQIDAISCWLRSIREAESTVGRGAGPVAAATLSLGRESDPEQDQ